MFSWAESKQTICLKATLESRWKTSQHPPPASSAISYEETAGTHRQRWDAGSGALTGSRANPGPALSASVRQSRSPASREHHGITARSPRAQRQAAFSAGTEPRAARPLQGVGNQVGCLLPDIPNSPAHIKPTPERTSWTPPSAKWR